MAYKSNKHSKEFIEMLLKNWYNGLSARQISEIPEMIKEYSINSNTPLTRNVIIGIVHRIGASGRNGISTEIREQIITDKVSMQKVIDDIKEEQKRIRTANLEKKYRKRSCLRCKEIIYLPKNIYICDLCKKSNKILGNTETYSVYI